MSPYCNKRMSCGTGRLIMACHNLSPGYVIALDQFLRDMPSACPIISPFIIIINQVLDK